MQVMFHALMMSSMKSLGYKVGQILILPPIFQLEHQKIKILQMLMAILLAYSNSGITPGKKKSSQIMQKKYFCGDDVTGSNLALYSCLGEFGSTSKLQGQFFSSINVDINIIFLGYTCLKKISVNDTFQDRKSKVKVTGLLGDHGA